MKRSFSRRAARVLAGLGLMMSLQSDDFGVRHAPPAHPPYLTVMLLDGLSREVFEQELAAGRLPNLQAMVREGAKVDHGIASFPSMTAYGFYPFITGFDASKSGVLGLRWFNRKRHRGQFRSYVGSTYGLMNRDFHGQPPTLYERFPDVHSFSLNTYANRGVKEDVKVGWGFTMAKYRHQWWVVDLLSALPLIGKKLVPTWEQAEHAVVDLALADLEFRPKIQWITFTSPDAYQHVYGTDDRYVALVRAADAEIGRYRERSRALGQEVDRVYAVVTDHGVADAKQNLDLRQVLRDRTGLIAERDHATHLAESELEDDPDVWARADAVVVINGNMMNYLYFRDRTADPSNAWVRGLSLEELARFRPQKGPGPVDVVAALRSEPAVELVIGRSENGEVAIFDARGKGVISARDGGFSYRVEGADPFGYDAGRTRVLVDGRGHSRDEWLEASIGTRFPDAIYRVFALMEAESVGDLVVTAAPGWDFGQEYELFVGNYRGGHGGLRADQLEVPYLLAGPGVRPGARIDRARAEDIGATLFVLLGLSPPAGADGRVLREALAR